MRIDKVVLYIVVFALSIAGAILIFGKTRPNQSIIQNNTQSTNLSMEQKASIFTKYNEIENPAGFVNTGNESITLGEFIGKKVILIDFVTYSCINCQRTFPYLVSWYDKYRDKGLEIIAIHTPEFAFEHKKENVEKAFKEFGLKFPAVLDNDYSTWNAYGNNYWPRKYLIDIDGFVVYDHIGEGKYAETESKIIELLNERSMRLGEAPVDASVISESTKKKLFSNQLSPETYLGSLREDKLFDSPQACEGGVCSYDAPIDIPESRFSLSGKWKQFDEYLMLQDNKGSLFYRFVAGKVHLVAEADVPVEAEVFIDGKPIDSSIAGPDVKDGKIVFSSSRLYTIVDTKGVTEIHLLELRFKSSGFRGYAFTFGE